MKVLDAPFLKAYVDMADHGDQLGWHERNGGNFTYWLTKEEAESIQENLSYEDPWKDIGTEVPYLANEYFLISGTGRYFHNMKKDPANTAGIIQLDEVGKRYRICWGLTENGRPTSELPTHLMNMEVKARMTNNQNPCDLSLPLSQYHRIDVYSSFKERDIYKRALGNDDRMSDHLPTRTRCGGMDGTGRKRNRNRYQQS